MPLLKGLVLVYFTTLPTAPILYTSKGQIIIPVKAKASAMATAPDAIKINESDQQKSLNS